MNMPNVISAFETTRAPHLYSRWSDETCLGAFLGWRLSLMVGLQAMRTTGLNPVAMFMRVCSELVPVRRLRHIGRLVQGVI